MTKVRYASIALRAFYEIARYEAILRLRGFGSILRHLRRQPVVHKTGTAEVERAICDAVLLATCFYWKPVLCLQRAVCTVRLLRKYGIRAQLAIGYRPAPFFSHAWVEINGRVAYGSSAYQQRLQTLITA